mmetsp:Transcript_30427/g.64420  ORF Transcript_30427/g.64420 Transcript_30427/m.64420 type:complete len:237 (-) Transcript_30427:213-923(-)
MTHHEPFHICIGDKLIDGVIAWVGLHRFCRDFHSLFLWRPRRRWRDIHHSTIPRIITVVAAAANAATTTHHGTATPTMNASHDANRSIRPPRPRSFSIVQCYIIVCKFTHSRHARTHGIIRLSAQESHGLRYTNAIDARLLKADIFFTHDLIFDYPFLFSFVEYKSIILFLDVVVVIGVCIVVVVGARLEVGSVYHFGTLVIPSKDALVVCKGCQASRANHGIFIAVAVAVAAAED